MKMKRSHLIPLLLAVPMLMANSPAPHVVTNDYKDFTYLFVSKTPLDRYYEGEQYIEYSFEITNEGSGYIDVAYIKYNSNAYTHTYMRDDMFGQLILPPNKSGIYSLVTLEDIDVTKVEPTVSCTAYTQFVENAFKSDKKDIQVDGNRYYIDYESDYEFDSNYRYGMIIDFTYDGVDYSIHEESSWRSESGTRSTFFYQGDIDINKVTINKLTMTYSDYPKSHIGEVIYGILIFLAVCLGIMFIGGLFCIIFFSIKKARRRKAMMNS